LLFHNDTREAGREMVHSTYALFYPFAELPDSDAKKHSTQL